MTLKPCIQCGKECEILPVQLGDFYTLKYLRICGGECMFLVAYEFIRDNCEHKQFQSKLHDLQDAEDKKLRDELVKKVTDESIKSMKENFKPNPNLLSMPIPESISEMFSTCPPIPECCGQTMKFTRPSVEDKIKWQKERIDRLEKDLQEALNDLKKLENK